MCCSYKRTPEFIPGFSGVRVTRSLVLCLCFVDRCLSFCTFLLAILLSVLLRFTDSDYLPLLSSSSSYSYVCFVDRCLSFCTFLLAILLSVLLRFTDSDYLPLLSSSSSYSYVCFVDRCLSFCTFSFGHCVVCSSSIYGI